MYFFAFLSISFVGYSFFPTDQYALEISYVSTYRYSQRVVQSIQQPMMAWYNENQCGSSVQEQVFINTGKINCFLYEAAQRVSYIYSSGARKLFIFLIKGLKYSFVNF